MLYYWQTKYTTSIYRPFFIFPFQPSEDSYALLSELPPLSQNVVHAADPSQIRKDGSRRVPDQGYRRGVEELPSQLLLLITKLLLQVSFL
jgi:hypothetical protein